MVDNGDSGSDVVNDDSDDDVELSNLVAGLM